MKLWESGHMYTHVYHIFEVSLSPSLVCTMCVSDFRKLSPPLCLFLPLTPQLLQSLLWPSRARGTGWGGILCCTQERETVCRWDQEASQGDNPCWSTHINMCICACANQCDSVTSLVLCTDPTEAVSYTFTVRWVIMCVSQHVSGCLLVLSLLLKLHCPHAFSPLQQVKSGMCEGVVLRPMKGTENPVSDLPTAYLSFHGFIMCSVDVMYPCVESVTVTCVLSSSLLSPPPLCCAPVWLWGCDQVCQGGRLKWWLTLWRVPIQHHKCC